MIPSETLNSWAQSWAAFMWGSLIDATIILAVVAVVWLALRRWMSAQLGYCLFLLVVIKLIVPIHVTVPGWTAYLSPRHAVDRITAWAMSDASEPLGHRNQPIPELDGMPENMLNLGGRVPEATSPPSLSLEAKLMCGWSMVVLSLLAWFAWVQCRLSRVLRQATPVEPATLPVDLAHLQKLAGVRQRVRLCTSPLVSSPAIGGLLRPRLVLPVDVAKTLTPRQLSWVLLHELAHIRRHDLWVEAVQRLVQITQFFNPAVWLANRVINHQREYACDDEAVVACDAPRRECGSAFLSIVERAVAQPVRLAPALGVFNAKSSCRRRLMRILDKDRPVYKRLTTGSTALLVALALVVLPHVRAGQQSSLDQPTASPPGGASENSPTIVQPGLGEAGTESGAVVDEEAKSETQAETQDKRVTARDTDSDAQALSNLGARIERDGDEVVYVSLRDNRQITDADLVYLMKLPWRKTRAEVEFRTPFGNDPRPSPALNLAGTEITDAGVEHLKGLTNLRTLHLHDTEITDAGLVHLKALTSLVDLWLHETEISDAGLVHLKALTSLVDLCLCGTEISDAGLVHLKGLTSLKTLWLHETEITDAGLVHLKGLNSLERLWLTDTEITDAGLVHLKGLTSLEMLWLRD